MAWWVFQNVVATAILALIVAAICRSFRISPGIRHALWMLVLIKFITPPVVTWPWPVPDPFGLGGRVSTVENSGPTETAVAVLDDRGRVSTVENSGDFSSALSPEFSTVETRPLTYWLLLVWLAGALVVLLVEAVRLLRVTRSVRSAREADPAITERVLFLAARLDMPPVPVLAMPTITSPAMWCLGRPRLLWPAELPADFSDACIDGLIVHELAHIKRRDHVVGWMELAASVVWWWNPLFWWVRSALREQAELACDGWVIAALPNGRRAYAESLLALSSAVTVDGPASPMTAVLGVRARSRRALERRLVMIMKGRASHRLPVLGLVGLGMLAVATLPVWAAGTQQTPPPTAPVPVVTTVATQPPTAATWVSVPNQQTPPPPPPPGAPPAAPQAPTAARPTPAQPPPPPAAPVPQGADFVRAYPSTTTAPPAVPVPQTTVRPGQGAATAAPSRPTAAAPQGVAVPAVTSTRGVVRGPGGAERYVYVASTANLPADAQSQVKSYETDREALQAEVERKLETKRADLTKSLQALQEKYTKEGKLDEALAIRDYIRSLTNNVFIRREAR